MEEKIALCGRPVKDFDEIYRTTLQFLENPHKIWVSGGYEAQRAVLKLAFTRRLKYVRNEGHRTAQISLPFKMLGYEKGRFCGLNHDMVEVAGIEPASVDPTHTGGYMLSLRFKLTDLPVGRQTYKSASPITFSSRLTGRAGERSCMELTSPSPRPTGEPGGRTSGIKPLVRSCRRWQLLLCSWIYEELCTSTCSDGFATDVEASHPHGCRDYITLFMFG